MGRWKLLPILMLSLAVVFADGMVFSTQAAAQDDSSDMMVPPGAGFGGSGNSGGGLFRLFRFEPRQRQPRAGPQVVRPSGPATPAIALPPPKDADAGVVLVLGDEMADQMFEGLKDRFDGDRTIRATSVSIPGSGVTDPAAFDWMVEGVRRIEDTEQLAAVVVALGFSDHRALQEAGNTFEPGTPEWRQFYRNRMATLALTLLAEGRPVIFVGLPPMADPVRNEEVRTINRILEEAVAPTRARFVAIYDAFADVNGAYVRSGPDMAGQVRNLRTSEGIFFNRAGREKFAHFVERFIPRDGEAGFEPEVSSVIYEGSSQSADGVGPVILLTSGFADPAAGLITTPQDVRPEDDDARALFLRGMPLDAPEGRADFGLRRAQGG